MFRISILGNGAWGTALAIALQKTNNKIILWARDPQKAKIISETRKNQFYLPKVNINKEILITSNLNLASKSDIILLATTAQSTREISQKLLSQNLNKKSYVISCSKGIETKTGYLISEIISKTLPNNPYAVLSGPTFASEVVKNLPAAATIASHDIEISKHIAQTLSNKYFKLFPSNDVIGVEIAGAIKNVIAIASGIILAKNLGDNARAALITRGIIEISKLGIKKGAKLKTFLGLSGIGDILLTSSSTQSRNTSLGFLLGKGKKLNDILKTNSAIAEGIMTSTAIMSLANKLKIKMPICSAVYNILNNKADIDTIINNILNCPIKEEFSELID